MPLRDHFRPPVTRQAPWTSIHAGWPMEIVRQLYGKLSDRYRALPKVHIGATFELDVAAGVELTGWQDSDPGGGTATAVQTATELTLDVDIDRPEPDEFEVRIYDEESERRLVAAVEIVSPGDKDREETRQAFVDKWAALLDRGVCVLVVDVVTERRADLYADLLERVGAADAAAAANRGGLYAVSHRWRRRPKRRTRAEAWYRPLAVGGPLPTLPLWLGDDVMVPLELEVSYEETCKYLRVG